MLLYWLLDDAWHDVAALHMQVWIQQAHKLLQLPCLVAMPEDAPEFEMACTAVLNRFTAALYSTPAQTGKVFATDYCSAILPLLCC